nr:MAG TPA: Protein of unknown function (DUF1642) [Caudoviricetes sp.]
MNKKEMIEKYEYLNHNCFRRVDTSEFLRDLKQLDEPEKITIPQFVANYIEQTKNEDYHLLGAMTEIRSHKNKEIDAWFYTDDNIEVFARAWLDGYEVEEEKRYRAKVKGMNSMNGYLARNKNLGTWYFGISGNDKNHCTNHTRKELEETGFGWVFDCPGIEVEEVTE